VVSQDDFLAIYHNTVERLYALVAAHTAGDRGLAEDVVQETYMRALSVWRRKGFPREPIAWLNTVALNLLRTHFRSLSRRERQAREQRTDSHESSSSPTPEKTVALCAALSQLPSQQIQLLEGFHVEGKRVSEMASETGLSERAVEGRLRRARVALRKKLRPLFRN